MSNKVKDIYMTICTYCFFNNIMNIKNFGPNNIKIDEKSYKNILIHYIEYVAIKDSKYGKINSVNLLYLIFNNGSKYLNKEIKYLALVTKLLWSKIRDLISSITKTSDDSDEKFMKIKFNPDDEFPLNKSLEIPSMTIVVRAFFLENNKYYPQVFLDECLYKI